jgi:hypothetical protein
MAAKSPWVGMSKPEQSAIFTVLKVGTSANPRDFFGNCAFRVALDQCARLFFAGRLIFLAEQFNRSATPDLNEPV